MKKEDKDDCLLYFIESMQDFLEYKKQCREKQSRINEYKKSKPYETEDEFHLIATEQFNNYYQGERKNSLITFDDIICYLEELPIEQMEDGKAIQIMLYELVGSKCNAKEYKRISDSMKKKKRIPTNVIEVMEGAQYVGNIERQNNNYGRKRKKRN